MKTLNLILIFSMLAFSCLFATDVETDKCSKFSFLNHVDLEIEDGTIILSDRDYDGDTVEITEDYELFVNGRRIKTTDSQKEMLKEYYEGIMHLIVYAKKIGIEGAKIGVKGAKIGAKALVGVLKMVFTSYDDDDLEEDIEDEAAEIEEMAEKLEEDAKDLEILADNLEDLHYDLKDEFKELRDLDWF